MHGISGNILALASNTGGISASKSVANDCDWFSRACRWLYPLKAGTALYLTTGLGDERACQRYAAGTVKPPAFFLRALLRSDHGSQWLEAVMAGSNAIWWRDYQEAVSLKAAVDAHRK
jgi:hypothetical protein